MFFGPGYISEFSMFTRKKCHFFCDSYAEDGVRCEYLVRQHNSVTQICYILTDLFCFGLGSLSTTLTSVVYFYFSNLFFYRTLFYSVIEVY